MLGNFFERFQTELEKAGVTLPSIELADAPYYSAVARVLLAPEDLPVEMSEVLFAIDALSSEAGEDQLEAAMKKEKPPLTFATKSSRADMAMQVWLARPELLARVYNEARLIRVSAFEFHGTPAPVDRRKTFTLPDKARHAALVKAVGADDCQRVPGLKCLLLRKVGKANMENFEDLRRRLFGGLRHEFAAYRGVLKFANGSRIIAGHFQSESDIDAYLGLEYDVIGIEDPVGRGCAGN